MIANLERYPLVQKYFGDYLTRLVETTQGKPFDGRFIIAAFDPEGLEKRLQSIDHLGQTSAIVREIGNVQDPTELDKRLMTSWAELRTVFQLDKEGFTNTLKVKVTADFTATRANQLYAFQVTRTSVTLQNQVEKRNKPEERDGTPYGVIEEIRSRLGNPTSYVFWNALEEKNSKFKNWQQPNSVRCMVIVSSDEDLQDALVRHIACQQIRESIHALVSRHFEELLWLPDLGNGAWFKAGNRYEETRCFVDWGDNLFQKTDNAVNRQEVNLDSPIHTFIQSKSGG